MGCECIGKCKKNLFCNSLKIRVFLKKFTKSSKKVLDFLIKMCYICICSNGISVSKVVKPHILYYIDFYIG